ncbi:HIT family protein [Phytoactinopolyspora endophytica]|uniref:HIT family protein n=1 Tax=Phytoactinopolyspora endophytica TaxID=1642495 RepID=UPI00101DE22B|nr:HIT domain-containing protein [Phytoactinopolyspora endophytica]
MSLVLPINDPCPFCEYLSGRRPYTIVERDQITATLVTREQRGQGHVLVVPVEHRETILDLRPHEADALITSVRRAARLVKEAFEAEGIAIWQKNGVPAYQTVPHTHFHVAATLPNGGTHWGPVPTMSIEETDAIARRLRAVET